MDIGLYVSELDSVFKSVVRILTIIIPIRDNNNNGNSPQSTLWVFSIMIWDKIVYCLIPIHVQCKMNNMYTIPYTVGGLQYKAYFDNTS